MSKVNMTQIVHELAKTSGLSINSARDVTRQFVDIVSDHLAKGESVHFQGFGSLNVYERSAYTGRNPSTGEPLDIPARRNVKFNSSRKLREELND